MSSLHDMQYHQIPPTMYITMQFGTQCTTQREDSSSTISCHGPSLLASLLNCSILRIFKLFLLQRYVGLRTRLYAIRVLIQNPS